MEAFIALAPQASPFELLVATTRTMVQLFGERGSCILVDGRARVAFSTEASGAGSTAPIDDNIDIGLYPEIALALETGDIVSIDDVLTDPRMESVKASLPPSLCSVTCVPLICGERRLGAVHVQSTVHRAGHARSLEEALAISKVASLLIDARTEGRLETVTAEPANPVREPSKIPSAAAGADATAPEKKRRKVLVVDDDADQADALEAALTDEGYEVRTASDGVACLRAVRESAPDLVLMDVSMPGIDGTRAAEQLRQDPAASHASIIFLSGADDLLTRMRNLALEDTDFLPKPYSLDQLLVRMERSFERVEGQKRLREEAHLDELTRLGNLRLLRERLATEASRLERYGTPASVVLVDVDKLKMINDQHGHPAGSEALKAIGAVLKAEIRETDLAVRYGGDEFVVLLPHTALTEGLAFADRVLRQIRLLRPGGIAVTASLGVAAREKRSKRSFESLLANADVAVYRAKHGGGNRVSAYSDTGGEELPSDSDEEGKHKSAV